MNSQNIVINAIGMAYGVLLILAAFVRGSFIEAMRIDALFIKDCTEQTRRLNLIFGLLIAGYAGYSLLS